MSWKSAIQYAKGVIGHEPKEQVGRADKDLPLGARIGGVLNMQMSDFIRASVNGSMVNAPERTQMLIVAISKVDVGLQGQLHRFYTNVSAEKESFLQVFTKADGEVAELMYCTSLVRIIPETEEEQNALTGEGGSGLGERSYTLHRGQIESIGYDQSALNGIFGELNEVSYERDIGASDRDFFAPLQGTETRIDDANGVTGLKQSIYFMPYVRPLGDTGGKEYLVITTEIVQSQDGDTTQRSIHSDFMIGIALDPQRISIQ